MSKVLVTGGSGFIGTNLIESLISKQNTVLNIDKASPHLSSHWPFWKNIDILDRSALEEAILAFEPEYIIHLAAVTDIVGKDLKHYETNTEGTKNIIEISEKVPSLKRVIYTSSMYVCKPGFIPSDYDTYTPHTIYGESKAVGERLVKGIKNPAHEWVIIRPTSIWGPWFSIPYIDFFDTVYKKRYVDFGSACTKTYGYIGNTTFQIVKLLEADDVNGKVFYLGDLPPTQISEWANEISIAMNKGKIRKVPYWLLKSVALVGDFLKLFKVKFPLTSFRLFNMTTNNILPLTDIYKVCGTPPYTRLEGVEKTLQWMHDNKGYKF